MTPFETARSADVDSGQSGGKPLGANADRSNDDKPGVLANVWRTVSAVIGALMGLLPHVLHHVGLIAGAALVTGAGGNVLFGVLGFLLSIPLLLRLYRRFNTWKAPGIALIIFAGMFALSAFVIGPAISGSPDEAPSPSPSPSLVHGEHHGG